LSRIAIRRAPLLLRQGFIEYGDPYLRCSLITDPEGDVQHHLSTWANDGVEPSSYSPLDLINVAKLVVLGIAAVGVVAIRMAARRLARKALEDAIKGELPAAARTAQRDPIAVTTGAYMRPGSLASIVEVDLAKREVTYRVKSIVFKGEGDAAQISLARAAHREMIRRTAKKAEENGLTRFKMLGSNAGPDFRLHADNLARTIGVPDSGLVLAGDGGAGWLNYEVTLEVSKIRASNVATGSKQITNAVTRKPGR
jgi:hypothetical protein